MTRSCCAINCTNRQKDGWKMYNIPRRSHPFDRTRRTLWLQAIKRADWGPDGPKGGESLCSAHFVSGAPSFDCNNPDFVPSIFLHGNTRTSGRARGKRIRFEDKATYSTSQPFVISSEHLGVRGGAAGKAAAAASSSVVTGNGNWDGAGGLDQITVVRIDDSHIATEQCEVGGKQKDEGATAYYEMEYQLPTAEEVMAEEEEEEGVYVIEYSNPEEEGESYQFTMSVDRSLPHKKPMIRHPAAGEVAVTSKPSGRPTRQRPEARKRKATTTTIKEEEVEVKMEEVASFNSNKSVLELGEEYSEVMGLNSDSEKRQLICALCPPPGRCFKRASGLAVHLKLMHNMEGKKTFFCTSCQQTVRTQLELDNHTRRHANQDAVFTCFLCSAPSDIKEEEQEEGGGGGGKVGFKGSRWGLRRHLEAEHPGVIPRCDICNKGFKSLVSYLSDQFRHVGVSPYYCARCKIYEMTARGLNVHLKNHDKKQKLLESAEKQPLTHGVSTSADNSATDDSDF